MVGRSCFLNACERSSHWNAAAEEPGEPAGRAPMTNGEICHRGSLFPFSPPSHILPALLQDALQEIVPGRGPCTRAAYRRRIGHRARSRNAGLGRRRRRRRDVFVRRAVFNHDPGSELDTFACFSGSRLSKIRFKIQNTEIYVSCFIDSSIRICAFNGFDHVDAYL